MKPTFALYTDMIMNQTEMFHIMKATIEASMHHREANVLVHTQMVLEQYNNITPDKWTLSNLEGAFACLFHDVGKPQAEVNKHSEERGDYHSYPGHEIISARMWENWIVDNYTAVHNLFPEFGIRSIYNVGWMIEHHLPYGITNSYKKLCIYKTGRSMLGNTFTDVLIADANGRINDNKEAHELRQNIWLDAYNEYENVDSAACFDKHLYVLIGASGTGKSTIVESIVSNSPEGDVQIFSLDDCRLNWYSDDSIIDSVEQYEQCYHKAVADPEFIRKAQHGYTTIVKRKTSIVVVDGTNLSAKRRRFYLDLAKANKRTTHAIYVTSSLSVIAEHQDARHDKYISADVSTNQYNKTQYPSYHEFDDIIVL